MCEKDFIRVSGIIKENNLKVNNWLRNQNTKQLLLEFESLNGYSGVIVKRGGKPNEVGTWIHSDLLIDFLTWVYKKPNRKKYFRDEEHLDQLIRQLFPTFKVIKQYPVLNYFVDWYIPELNYVIEYDEKHHNHTYILDEHRKKQIIKQLNCIFIILNQDDKTIL